MGRSLTAEHTARGVRDLADLPTRALVGAAVVTGVGGYLLVVIWGSLLVGLLGPLDGLVERQVASGAALVLGALTATRVFLAWAELDAGFLDVRRPSLRSVGWGAVGLGAVVGLSLLVSALSVPTADHGLADEVRAAGPSVLPALVAVSLLAVGPAEELLYRNVVQKTLAAGLGQRVAVAGASAVFALAHIPAYLGDGTAALVGSLGVVFVLSTILGTLYARTRSLVVVAAVHGLYNAVAFADLALVAAPLPVV